MAVSPEQIAQWQALIDQDPAVRQAAQQMAGFHQQTGVYGTRNPLVGPQAQWQAAVQAAKAKYGIPEDFEISYEGGRPTVQARSWMDQHGKALSNTIIGVGAGLTGAGAAGLFGGGGSAAGGGAMAAENVAPFSGLPGAIPGAGAGALPAVGAGALPAAGGGLLDTILKVAPVGAGLVNKLATGGFGGDAGPAGQMSPELQQLLELSMKRMQDQEPLFQSVTKQALAGLPTYAQGK